jgi:hypothetical protein
MIRLLEFADREVRLDKHDDYRKASQLAILSHG